MKTTALPKRKGEWAEVCFLARALALGLHVSKPYGDSAPYDFIVDSGRDLLRVQVKCATRLGTNGYQFRLTHGYDQRRYRRRDFDLLAAYIAPENTWYIIPWSIVGRRSVFWLCPKRGIGRRFAPYREAWQLLRVPRDCHPE